MNKLDKLVAEHEHEKTKEYWDLVGWLCENYPRIYREWKRSK